MFTKAAKEIKVDAHEAEEGKTTGTWQGIMNACYDVWQDEADNRVNSYEDLTAFARMQYGLGAEFAVLLGKYNQQVCNGGHAQYFDNGYGSTGKGGCFVDHDNIDLHYRLIELFKELNIAEKIDSEVAKTLLTCLEGFEVIEEDGEDEGDSYQMGWGDDDLYYTIDEKVAVMVDAMFAKELGIKSPTFFFD